MYFLKVRGKLSVIKKECYNLSDDFLGQVFFKSDL